VHQVAEDGEGLSLGLLDCKGDGVAHAEAHAQMFCTYDFHVQILCGAKLKTMGLVFRSKFIDYLGLVCWIICSSKLMYVAKALWPAGVNPQVVSGRLF
jgi:hypothetical protein